MDISPELQALFAKGREMEKQLPPCDRCGEQLRFYGSQPGVECLPCKRIWLWSFNTGKSIECAWQHHTSPSGVKVSMLLPIKKDEPEKP